MTLSENHVPEQSRIEGVLSLPEKILGPLVGLTLFSMMVITFVDVIGRYVLNSPIPGGLEITEYLMALVIFMGLPILSAEEGHVTVDLLDHLLPQALRHLNALFVNFFSFVVMAVLSWRLWTRAEETAEYGDITPFLEVPLGPLVYFMSIMVGLTALLMFLIAINNFGKSFIPDAHHREKH
ncbi:MAG: TRAP transporter small permease [SAR324 cluster bacterium]|nr:TRAP transporter small permease [SAR324 cluster bacterium]